MLTVLLSLVIPSGMGRGSRHLTVLSSQSGSLGLTHSLSPPVQNSFVPCTSLNHVLDMKNKQYKACAYIIEPTSKFHYPLTVQLATKFVTSLTSLKSNAQVLWCIGPGSHLSSMDVPFSGAAVKKRSLDHRRERNRFFFLLIKSHVAFLFLTEFTFSFKN